jgi:RNA polymerase sigma factor (sigma-70 family)
VRCCSRPGRSVWPVSGISSRSAVSSVDRTCPIPVIGSFKSLSQDGSLARSLTSAERGVTACREDCVPAALMTHPSFEERFRALFTERFRSIFRYLHRLSGDAELAADLAQESFVRLYQRGAMPDDASAWLIAVANNLLRDEQRKVGRRKRLLAEGFAKMSDPGLAASSDSRVIAGETVARVRKALESLPLRDRQLLLLRHEGYSYREIASALRIAQTSVGTLLSRANIAFRSAFQELHGAPD